MVSVTVPKENRRCNRLHQRHELKEIQMAEETKAAEVAGDVVEGGTELVKITGVSSEVLGSEAGGTFLPQLSEDMPLDQRKEVIRTSMKKAILVDDRLGLVQGELLYEVAKNGYWKEWTFTDASTGEIRNFKTFDEYVEVELDMKRRKAFYLISIYEKFVVELSLPVEILQSLEWSKAKELIPVINAENWTELLDRIKDMSVKQVIEMAAELKGAKAGTRADKEPTTTVTLSFKLHPEQAENVTNALKVAETMTGSDKPGNQLDLICTDFVAGAVGAGLEGALGKLDVVIANVERAFGVKLEVKEVDAARFAKSE